MGRDKIITEIVAKGTIIGACAKYWVKNKKKSGEFIIECADMCRHKPAQDLWGPELVSAILKYANSRKQVNKRVTLFDLKVIKTIKNLRKTKGIKQDMLADALEMTQGNYCKVENGLMPLALGQFEIIAKEFEMDIFDLLKLVKNSETTIDSLSA